MMASLSLTPAVLSVRRTGTAAAARRLPARAALRCQAAASAEGHSVSRRDSLLSAAAAAAALSAAAAGGLPAPALAAGPGLRAICTLSGTAGVAGTVILSSAGSSGPTTVEGKITGLKPGLHGFHIHQFGDTSNGCISTGGHFNPAGKSHGGPSAAERHAGDLGNITADASGVAAFTITDVQIPLSGAASVVGRAMVVHADADDLGLGGVELSKTTGNAGGRLACGIIGYSAPPAPPA